MLSLSIIGTRIRQALNFRKSSFPYLSGDTFRLSSDFHFEDISDFNNDTSWDDIKIVFCKSESLEIFKSEKPFGLKPKVIICGNSDLDFHSINLNGLSTVKAVFLQNSFISDQKRIFTLPIGLENASHASNGRPRLYSRNLVEYKNHKILVGPFGNTHLERSQLKNLSSNETFRVIQERVSTKLHIENIDACKYVACPRGNGVDTHRVWESMYRGSTPILLRNSWSESFAYYGFPIILIDGWDEISEVLKDHQAVTPTEIRGTPYLWMQTWKKLISTFL